MSSPFLDSVRKVIRSKYYSIKTERTYLYWIVAYIRFHGNQYPEQLGELDIRQYLTHLAIDGNVSPNTQKTALNALVFMYRQVLNRELGDFGDFYRARAPKKLPTRLRRSILGHRLNFPGSISSRLMPFPWTLAPVSGADIMLASRACSAR